MDVPLAPGLIEEMLQLLGIIDALALRRARPPETADFDGEFLLLVLDERLQFLLEAARSDDQQGLAAWQRRRTSAFSLAPPRAARAIAEGREESIQLIVVRNVRTCITMLLQVVFCRTIQRLLA